MTTSLPYAEYPVTWEGDGPNIGAGASDSDAIYGEQQMVVTQVSLQPLRTISPPVIAMHIERDGPALPPLDTVGAASVASAPSLALPLTYENQDMVAGGIVGSDYLPPLALGAPPVALGGTLTRGV